MNTPVYQPYSDDSMSACGEVEPTIDVPAPVPQVTFRFAAFLGQFDASTLGQPLEVTSVDQTIVGSIFALECPPGFQFPHPSSPACGDATLHLTFWGNPTAERQPIGGFSETDAKSLPVCCDVPGYPSVWRSEMTMVFKDTCVPRKRCAHRP